MTKAETPNEGRLSEALDDHVLQVFYCHWCNPPIYMKVKINAKLEHLRVVIVCPYCGHKHPRTIKKGVVVDDRSGVEMEEIHVLKSACSTKNPLEGIRTIPSGQKDGVVVGRDTFTDQFLRERWLEKAASEKGEL